MAVAMARPTVKLIEVKIHTDDRLDPATARLG
ncbi:hypothetical protein STAFG_0567 [Streptomyces afghaniensis 772]|uniref:Uncharacterized protein n=1 Tax=Streptomyces afghaniensis 772 TaxID=1283301 RepID=S4N134_9ACTN|nr:hypothetical protein STAFG_0567 [Streptomyces afghaniensis 772]